MNFFRILMTDVCLAGLTACGSKNGLSVNASGEKADVKLPGVHISTGEKGNTDVSVPGVNVSTDEKGATNVSVPGIDIKTGEEKPAPEASGR